MFGIRIFLNIIQLRKVFGTRKIQGHIYTKDLDKIHREEDKFKKSEDLKTQRALDAADSRPLHRKGSLNRVGMDENVIRKLVSETIKNVLKDIQ